MPNYTKGKTGEVPEQVAHPGEASEGYETSKDGVIYPKQRGNTVQDYNAGEGSMGFDRNQGVTRDQNSSEVIVIDMGQNKLQKLDQNNLGSRAI